MGNDFKAILTKSSGAISDHLKLSQSFMTLVICPLHVVRGNGTNTCRGIKKIYDKLQHRLWASVVCCHRGKAPTEPSLDYYCSWYWFGKTQGTWRSNKPVVMKSATLGFLCCKSCPSVPRHDSCWGNRIAPLSQAGRQADSGTVPRSEPNGWWVHWWFTWEVQASNVHWLTRQIWSEFV